jgi:hypothetical protein
MKSATYVLLWLPLVACGSGSPAPQSSSGSASGRVGQASGSSAAAGHVGSGTTSTLGTGATSGTSASGTVSGSGASGGGTSASGTVSGSGASSGGMSTSGTVSASGAAGSGATSGAVASGSSAGASSGGVNFDAGLPPGSVNMVPAGYTGQPFALNEIPGLIYMANYDKGGAGVAYCHGAPGQTSPAQCSAAIKLTDWCCGKNKGCDDRNQTQGPCPTFRADDDNAGLSHMNQGEPDDYATTGPSWAPGPNGPTLTGPMVMAGTPVPQDATTTTVEDAYLSYTYTAEWLKFTVEVFAAGAYSVGGLMGVPGGTQLSIDFGPGITTGTFTPPASPCAWAGCPETYHSWNNVSDLAMVTFAAPGTYLMTFTIVENTINPLYFTFTQM